MGDLELLTSLVKDHFAGLTCTLILGKICFMLELPKNVWLLTFCQALMMSSSSIVVFVGGIVGNQLAPSPKLATLPVAAIIVGTALTTVPVALVMKKLGRKLTFISTGLLGIAISLLAAYSISIQSFYLYCVCMMFLGVSVASINQFRFAAMESVPKEYIPKAASTVLLGGIAAAFIGPETAVAGQYLLSSQFSGSFILLSGLFLFGILLLLFYQNNEIKEEAHTDGKRSLLEIISQPVFLVAVSGAMVGYAVMSFIMTATPVSMHVLDGHSLHDTKWVIQSHIVAMFLPSLFTAYVIKKIGTVNMMITGLIAFIICIGIAYSGHQVVHYWYSLILLGVGWNFLFIGGTTLLPQSYQGDERFKVQAFNDFMVFGTQAVAAISAGWIVHELGWEIMLLTTIPFLIIPVITIWRLKNS